MSLTGLICIVDTLNVVQMVRSALLYHQCNNFWRTINGLGSSQSSQEICLGLCMCSTQWIYVCNFEGSLMGKQYSSH